MGPSYAGMFDQHAQRLTGSGDYVSGGLQGYAGTQQEANNVAFSHNLSPGYVGVYDQYNAIRSHLSSMSRTHAEITRDKENENITRMWNRFSKPSPILTRILIWVSLGVSVSYTFLGVMSR